MEFEVLGAAMGFQSDCLHVFLGQRVITRRSGFGLLLRAIPVRSRRSPAAGRSSLRRRESEMRLAPKLHRQ
jgi:hypothetical protein